MVNLPEIRTMNTNLQGNRYINPINYPRIINSLQAIIDLHFLTAQYSVEVRSFLQAY
jgi:hypothetical protein